MRRIWHRLAFASALVALGVLLPSRALPLPPDLPRRELGTESKTKGPKAIGRILTFGDSITEGCCGVRGGYQKLLADRLTAAGIDFEREIRVVGRSGFVMIPFERSDGKILPGIYGLVDTVVAREHPDVVLLMIGTNDIGWASQANLAASGQPDLNGSWEHASARLGLLLDRLRAALPHAMIFTASIIPLRQGERVLAASEQYSKDVERLISRRQRTGDQNIVFVDMFSGFPSATGFASDGVHPNEVGQRFIADTFFAALSRWRESVQVKATREKGRRHPPNSRRR
jgi:lysophospholipase L1-like esterase